MAMQRVNGSNWVMRDAGAQVRNPFEVSKARLREQLRAESAGSNTPDITHLIGYGILLLAALLIAIGSATA
jgi:hypothetical protein